MYTTVFKSFPKNILLNQISILSTCSNYLAFDKVVISDILSTERYSNDKLHIYNVDTWNFHRIFHSEIFVAFGKTLE